MSRPSWWTSSVGPLGYKPWSICGMVQTKAQKGFPGEGAGHEAAAKPCKGPCYKHIKSSSSQSPYRCQEPTSASYLSGSIFFFAGQFSRSKRTFRRDFSRKVKRHDRWTAQPSMQTFLTWSRRREDLSAVASYRYEVTDGEASSGTLEKQQHLGSGIGVPSAITCSATGNYGRVVPD